MAHVQGFGLKINATVFAQFSNSPAAWVLCLNGRFHLENGDGGTVLDDYSFLQDLLETWRSTSDWVKAVILIAIPGYVAFFTWLVLGYRAEMRTTRDVYVALNEDRIRRLARAEMSRLAAEWERARKAKADLLRLTGDNDRSRLG